MGGGIAEWIGGIVQMVSWDVVLCQPFAGTRNTPLATLYVAEGIVKLFKSQRTFIVIYY